MYGTLENSDGRLRLRFVRRLHHSREKVWRALTEPDHLAAWFPTNIEGIRAASAPLRFTFRDGEGQAFEGRMITFDPPSRLEFQWGDNETLRFELEPDGDGCRLTFLNTFDELGKASRDATGWHSCLDALGYHLDGKRAPWTPQQHWDDVHEQYIEQLGPAASTIGPPEGRPSSETDRPKSEDM